MYSFYVFAFLPMAIALTGDMTYYTPGLGSCGTTSTDTDMIVAISAARMNSAGNPSNNPLCGSQITITNSAGVSQDATVVDTCPACAQDDIDVSSAVFQALATLDEGRVTVSWSGDKFSKRQTSDAITLPVIGDYPAAHNPAAETAAGDRIFDGAGISRRDGVLVGTLGRRQPMVSRDDGMVSRSEGRFGIIRGNDNAW